MTVDKFPLGTVASLLFRFKRQSLGKHPGFFYALQASQPQGFLLSDPIKMPDLDKGSDSQEIKSSAEFRATVAAAFDSGSKRMQRIEQQLAEQRQAIYENTTTTQQTAATTAENTQAIKAVHERTNEMVEVFNAMKGGFKVLGWLGQAVKWAAPVIGAIAAARHAITGGSWWPFH